MRAQEFITESRQAPLYHFTSVKGLARILGSDKLLGRNNRIYFTRDYSRNFVPNNIHIGSFGLRLDQELLRRDYGKKLRPMGQTSMSNRQRLAWLSDPENQAQIARYKADPESLRVSYGVDVGAAVRGDMGQRARWESEEVIDAKEIPNISRYLTGIVFAGGGASGGLVRGGDQYGKRSTRRDQALTDLVQELLVRFPGMADPDPHPFIELLKKRNIPMIFQRQDFSGAEIEQRAREIGKRWKSR